LSKMKKCPLTTSQLGNLIKSAGPTEMANIVDEKYKIFVANIDELKILWAFTKHVAKFNLTQRIDTFYFLGAISVSSYLWLPTKSSKKQSTITECLVNTNKNFYPHMSVFYRTELFSK